MKRIRILLIAAAAVPWLACSDGPITPEVDPADDPGPEPALLNLPELVVSNAIQAGASLPVLGGAPVSASSAEMAFVSLPPGTVPDMVSLVIRNVTANWASPAVPVLDGGVDPVPVPAVPGDQLRLEFTDRDGAGAIALATVPDSRPPTVVRTTPPRGRTDVALMVRPTVVFSEPIDPATLAAGVLLTLDGAPVEGSVELLPDLPWIARFVPAAEPEPHTTYELHVTTDIRDLDGDELEGPLTVPFTTGGRSSSLGGKYERVSPSFIPGTSWYEFEENNRFTLFYHRPDMAPFGYGGRYSRVGSRVQLDFDAWNLAGPWQADATLHGDSLWVEYNIVMMLADFEDGLYVRQSPPPEPPGDAIGEAHIHIARADGSDPTPLTLGSWPAWSPNGERIAFHRGSDVFVINADGSNETRLVAGGYPAWSPEGDRIVFTDAGGIAVMNADGSDVRTLIHHDFRDDTYAPHDMGVGKPAWSPDGERIAFEHFGDGDVQPAQIYVMNADGSNPRRLTTSPDGLWYAESDPAWSPDGSRIIFWSYGYGVATVDSKGGVPTTIYRNFPAVAYGARPNWSPNGRTIALSAYPLGTAIWTMPADGGVPSTLIREGYDGTWSPDGARIAFVRGELRRPRFHAEDTTQRLPGKVDRDRRE